MAKRTRRRFLGQAAGSAGVALVWPGAWLGLKNALASHAELANPFRTDAAPKIQFPATARERIAIASYPFREFIAGRERRAGDTKKMPLKEFAAHVSAKFNIKKIEPWSEHFRSLEMAYLEELRAAVEQAGGAIVNIAVDGEYSPYAADGAVPERDVRFCKQWIAAAAAIGSPSVRTNIAAAEDAKPNVERTAETLKRVAEYGAEKNVVVNLENDNAVSEDPFFVVKVIEKVNSAWLHALPDFGNSLAAFKDEYAYQGIDAMFGHAYNISHVKETEVNEVSEKIAQVDLPRTFGIAKQHGYKGYFSMEWDSPGDPYEGTEGLIEKTLENLSGT